MKSFEIFLSLLATIPDPRRAEGKLYQLRHMLLFAIFAIVSGANSYRGSATYFKVHRKKLNVAFGIIGKGRPRIRPSAISCSASTPRRSKGSSANTPLT